MNDSSRRIPKYANVPSKLHTGAKVEPKKLMSTRQVSQRHDEIFKRVKPSTLACWIQENEVTESVFGLVDDDKNWEARSDAPSAVPTITGSFVSVVAADADSADDPKDYVVYDMREAEEYASQHISSALSYPAALVNRDKISLELHKLKNSKKKLIVYHTNEALGAAAAAQLVQKGWENTCLLSGGFQDFAERYPELLEDGKIPDQPKTRSSAKSTSSSRPPRVPRQYLPH